MTTTQYARPALSPECMALLAKAEVYAEPIAANMVTLHDSEGDWLFRVHKSIHAIDLATMLAMHRKQFDAGMRAGRAQAFAELRALIGANTATNTGSAE